MKAFVLFLLTFIAFSGCADRPVITDNSTVVVQPGLGISNVCALGMTYRQIRAATHDAVLRSDVPWSFKRLNPWGEEARYVAIPSLCIQSPYFGDEPTRSIWIQVTATDFNPIPFRGKVGEKLSFKEGPVSREQVEAAIGLVKKTLPWNSEYFSGTNAAEAFFMEFATFRTALCYPEQGIKFDLTSNVVTEIHIFKPAKAKN